MNKLLLVSCLALAVEVPVWAGEYGLGPTDNPYAYTLETSSWRDRATGLAPSDFPTNRDTLVLSPLPNDSWVHFRVFNADHLIYYDHAAPVVFSSVTGDCSYVTFAHGNAWASGIHGKYWKGEEDYCSVTALDPDGFLGYWYSGEGRARFIFPSTPERAREFPVQRCQVSR